MRKSGRPDRCSWSSDSHSRCNATLSHTLLSSLSSLSRLFPLAPSLSIPRGCHIRTILLENILRGLVIRRQSNGLALFVDVSGQGSWRGWQLWLSTADMARDVGGGLRQLLLVLVFFFVWDHLSVPGRLIVWDSEGIGSCITNSNYRILRVRCAPLKMWMTKSVLHDFKGWFLNTWTYDFEKDKKTNESLNMKRGASVVCTFRKYCKLSKLYAPRFLFCLNDVIQMLHIRSSVATHCGQPYLKYTLQELQKKEHLYLFFNMKLENQMIHTNINFNRNNPRTCKIHATWLIVKQFDKQYNTQQYNQK